MTIYTDENGKEHRRIPTTWAGVSNPTWSTLEGIGWTRREVEPVVYVPSAEDLKAALLNAAVEYEKKYIQASGIGVLTLGVAAGAPKAVAVSQWLSALWLEHDHREALIDNGDTDPDYDFSFMGAIPHTVNELKQEALP